MERLPGLKISIIVKNAVNLIVLLTIINISEVTFAGHSPQVVNVQQITDQTMDVDNPAWSPDNNWLAFSNIKTNGSEKDELWVMNINSRKKMKLLDSESLSHFASYGYSIWNIKWLSNESLSFVISDNDVDSWLVELAMNSPSKFKSSPRDSGLFKDLPLELKKYLSAYYPKNSPKKISLEEQPFWYHVGDFEGKWYVQYLRDEDLLVLDLEKKEVIKSYLSSNDIGDNLKFVCISNKVLAVYPGSAKSDFIVDEIVPGNKAIQRFRIKNRPSFVSANKARFFVYSRTSTSHPFYNVDLFAYTFGDKLNKVSTDAWHNLAFTKDAKKVAFIKIVHNSRLLFVGTLK